MAVWKAPLTASLMVVVVLMGPLVGCGSPEDAEAGRSTTQDSAQVPERPEKPGNDRPAPDGPLAVSDAAVGESELGDPRRRTVARLSGRLGEPDRTVPPQQFERVDGRDEWYESAGDPISPSWAYPVFSATCWDGFCVLFGGESAADLALRGWELATYNRWSPEALDARAPEPGVALAHTGITLGDPWTTLHAAYPTTGVRWAEGASLGVSGTPWRTIFDGVDGWRVSGHADHDDPDRAPKEAVVTRLSAGEGPEPGCC